jgi:hypothetical protein
VTRRFSSREAKGSPPKKTKRELEREKEREQNERMQRECCKHYKGSQEICGAGIDIRKHVGGPDFGWGRRMPCNPGSPLCDKLEMVPCDKYEPPTEEELQKDKEETLRMLRLLSEGLSPCCEAPLDKSRLVQKGRYAGSGWVSCSKCKKAVAHLHARG